MPHGRSKSPNFWQPTRASAASSIPAWPSHPGHAIAARQMEGRFGAMLSFEIEGDFAKPRSKSCESTQLFQLAVSLGAVESLIEQPAAMSHASYDPAARQAFGITDGLIRLSVGLEAFEDLRDDLDQALPATSDPTGG